MSLVPGGAGDAAALNLRSRSHNVAPPQAAGGGRARGPTAPPMPTAGGAERTAGTFGEMPTSRQRRRGISGVSLLMVVLVGLGLYLVFRHVTPLLRGSDCTAAGGGQEITLGT